VLEELTEWAGKKLTETMRVAGYDPATKNAVFRLSNPLSRFNHKHEAHDSFA
jgi:hypothetical protein